MKVIYIYSGKWENSLTFLTQENEQLKMSFKIKMSSLPEVLSEVIKTLSQEANDLGH